MRMLRMYPNHAAAMNALLEGRDRPDVVTICSRMIWRHADGSETFFRVEPDKLRGIEWIDIWLDEGCDLSLSQLRVRAMERPTASDSP